MDDPWPWREYDWKFPTNEDFYVPGVILAVRTYSLWFARPVTFEVVYNTPRGTHTRDCKTVWRKC